MRRAFAFDMDGTIVDNMAFHTQSWITFFERRGRAIDADEFFRTTAGRQGPALFARAVDEGVKAVDRAPVRAIQLAVQHFLLVVQRCQRRVVQLCAQIVTQDFLALTASRVAKERIRLDGLAPLREECDPRTGVEVHIVDDGAIHVEDQCAGRGRHAMKAFIRFASARPR